MRTRTALALLGLLMTNPALAAEQKPDYARQQAEVTKLQAEVQQVESRLQVVEKQYAYRPEPNEAEALKRRFSDGEIQFLLTNYPQASVLFYDLLGNTLFRGMREYPEALYMLAESLYQQQNYLGARLYFREHMNLRGRHYRDSLSRYLEISGRVNEFSGIDGYIEQAKGPDGSLPADVAYVYAKWLFRRTDIPDDQRQAKATQAFGAIATAGGAFTLQSYYFLGVLAVQKKDLPEAAKSFERVLKLPARDERDRKVHELANLSLGRVYFEQGKYTESIDRYQEIDYRSEHFVDSLYEIAWTHVRKATDLARTLPGNGVLVGAVGLDGKSEDRTTARLDPRVAAEFEKANQACEKLLLAAPDSILAPEARILQGQLLLKLGKYQEATDTYSQIINTYLEVYDNIDGRLKAHSDPVKYFQKLISESEKTFDIGSFLPPLAVKWATTQKEVADAVRMTSDIDAGKQGIVESNEIAVRLMTTLETRSLEVFPTLQEGFSRAEAVDAALASVEGQLLRIEQATLGADRLNAVQAQLEAARKERIALEEKFKNLPKDEVELEARKKRMADAIAKVDQEAFRLGYQMESVNAVIAAIEKYDADTRDQRKRSVQEEREFAETMATQRALAQGLKDELAAIQKAIRDEKAKLGLGDNSAPEVRRRYEVALAQERDLMAGLRQGLPGEAQGVVQSVDQTRQQIATLKARSEKAKDQIKVAVSKKGQAIKEKVQYEAKLLKDYENEVKLASSGAQNLVGSIAFESFKRVRRQFYELVLKADVGIVDVAWTRKQDKTNQIQNLAKQKDKELKSLDEEFKEVLKESD